MNSTEREILYKSNFSSYPFGSARAYRRGCKNDSILILRSDKQGQKKSDLLRTLLFDVDSVSKRILNEPLKNFRTYRFSVCINVNEIICAIIPNIGQSHSWQVTRAHNHVSLETFLWRVALVKKRNIVM